MTDKANEFRRTFRNLPDVLIQDPVRDCAYLVPAEAMSEHVLDARRLQRIAPDTVTFSIPDGDILESVPPFLRSGSSDAPSSILIQYRHGATAYLLEWDALQQYRIEQPTEHPVGAISFILPVALEMIEQLSLRGMADLQSGTGRTDTEG